MRILPNIVFAVVVAFMAGVTVHQGLNAVVTTVEQAQMTMALRLSGTR